MSSVRARALLRPVAAALAQRWAPRSRLLLVGEGAGWSVDHDLQQLGGIASRLGVRLADSRLLTVSRGQAVFFGSQFTLLAEPWRAFPHALATAYFHGRPGTPGMPEFDVAYRTLSAHHDELERVQVTHAEMHELVLSSGIEPAKVFRIPIAVDAGMFTPQTPTVRAEARAALELPADAFVVGSFQKDGVGWGEGTEPKLIKGPDVLLEAMRQLREHRPELHLLLSGPARGYVRAGLDRLGIPYVHRRIERYEQIGRLYAALDAYVVPSRQEGGPKGVLEAMAAGVPVVSTRVGQAAELIRDGENGLLVDVDDAEALADRLASIDCNTVAAGVDTARGNTYETQTPLWRAFFEGFVARA
jgi:glycosyltransferase involved in cell wall biosynthesis